MPEWPADKVERWPLERLVPYARNARTHSAEQVAQIAGSIREWGWTMPVLVDEAGMLIAGHGRVLAARKLGLAEVPVMVARGWSEAQKRAYVLADNKLALNAGWDDGLLKVELADLQSMGAILQLIGFDDDELAELLVDENACGLTDPDEVPEPLAEPVSASGDVWMLGRHRLVCGDCTDAATVAQGARRRRAAPDGDRPALWRGYDPAWRNRAGRRRYQAHRQGRRTTTVPTGARPGRCSRATSPMSGTARCMPRRWPRAWRPAASRSARRSSGPRTGWSSAAATITGSTSPAGMPSGAAGIGPATASRRRSGRSASTRPGRRDGPRHPEAGRMHAAADREQQQPGQAVYEPFCGSGTTIIAAEMTGRVCHAIELNPVYVDVAVRRWQAFTGQAAMPGGGGAASPRLRSSAASPSGEPWLSAEESLSLSRPRSRLAIRAKRS